LENEYSRQFETGRLADCFFPFIHPIQRKGNLSVNTQPDSDDTLESEILLKYREMSKIPPEFFDRLRAALREVPALNSEADRVEDQVQLHISRALVLVYNYVRDRLEKTDTHVRFGMSDVYVVWFCKTLQNWKALVSTTLPDGMYYEVTYDGDRRRTYIDAYKKFENVTVPDDPPPTDLQRMEQFIEEAKEMPNLKIVTREGFDDVGSGLSSGLPPMGEERAKRWNPAGPDRFA
jgi:hypothetical protein